MKLSDFKEILEKQFVDDYDKLHEFMQNINNVLIELKIKNIYESYDIFCLDIEKYAFEFYNKKQYEITPKNLTTILNNMIKYKIINDPLYEKKIETLFDDDEIINEIKRLKN